MEKIYQSLDAQAAQAFLKRFPGDIQRRGHERFQSGAVGELIANDDGTEYRALVNDAAWHNEVVLAYNPVEGWEGQCSCPAARGCAHVFAAMSALLAEHRMALVRQLSTGTVATAAAAGRKSKPDPPEPEDLREKLASALGRRLNKDEASFMNRLHALFSRCRQNPHFTSWDFQTLGFTLRTYDWVPLKLWDSFPATEHEFWLFIANYLAEQKQLIPEFMLPITDLSLIAERLARWRRAQEIEKWKKTLSSLQATVVKPGITGEIDLRLMIDGCFGRLQWLRPGQTAFEPLKQQQFRQLNSDYLDGELKLTAEAELIWQLFSSEAEHGVKVDFGLMAPETERTLSRLLRMRTLESRIVDSTGQPLQRILEPLRWEVSPAESPADDYRLRLVRADGSVPPEIFCVLSGQPTLYVTAIGIFAGPEAMEDVLEPGAESRIPAPAIESSGGVALLDSLGVELPAKLRERVQKLPWQITIRCALRPTYPGNDVDDCVVNVTASAPNGREQAWNGFSWMEQKRGSVQKRGKNDPSIVVYDLAQLAEAISLLEPLNLKQATYQGDLVMRVNKKFAEIFVAWLKTIPPRITVELDGELASLRDGDVAGRVKLTVTEHEIDWFDLQVVLDVGDTTLTPQEIKLLLNAKGGYVRLHGKGWRRLQYDLSEEENDRLARLGLSPRELSAEPQRLHALQLADEAAKKFLPEQQVQQIQRRASEIKARVAPELPAGISAQLRPYQLEGFHFLAYLAVNRFGGILADDMGLGKTLQTLAWLMWLRQEGFASSRNSIPHTEAEAATTPAAGPGPCLVVCPKSVMDNWHAEAARFAQGLRVKAWPAGELGRLRDNLHEADVHVLNYSQLRSLGESLAPVQWLAVVLDEGQYIKNPSAQTSQIARALRARFRLVLSGTPIENRLLDLWSLMAFTMPGVLGSRAQFAKLYDAKGDPLARRRLAARVRPFLLRRTKSQVAQDLPDRIEEDLFCEIEGEQQTLYRAELKAAQQLLLKVKTQKELAQQQFHFLTSLLRLRQICCHPRLVRPESTAASAKTESLLEQLEPLMEEGQKVLVFSQFVQMLDLLRPTLEQRNWPVFYLAGQTENRGELVREFQAAAGPAVFLISLKAGGFGLNLTAASYVILFDPWWNPAVENQAIDRTHRIGQNNKVIAYRLLIKNSIEEKIRELQKQKKALAEDVFGEEKFAQSLTLNDLQFLFAD